MAEKAQPKTNTSGKPRANEPTRAPRCTTTEGKSTPYQKVQAQVGGLNLRTTFPKGALVAEK